MGSMSGPSALRFNQVSPTSTSSTELAHTIRTYTGQPLWSPKGARGGFGGQVIGQALHAALQSVPGRMGLHSMHIYFLLPADPSVPIVYAVEPTRDGKSYSTRFVRALQGAKVVAMVMASYSAPPPARATLPVNDGKRQDQQASAVIPSEEPAVSHSLRFAVESTKQSPTGGMTSSRVSSKIPKSSQASGLPPFQSRFALPCPDDILPMDKCELEPDRWTRYLAKIGEGLSPRRRKAVEEYVQERKDSTWEVAVAKRSSGKRVSDPSLRIAWLRPKFVDGEQVSQEDYKCVIACISDFQFIGTAARRLGLTAISNPRLGMLASLDHAIYFYPLPQNFDPRAPLLHVMEAVIVDTEPGRGVVRGRIYSEKGELIAVTMQEGVVRIGERPRGDLGESPRAKL